MIEIEGRMNRIHQVHMDEINWDKHWQRFYPWALTRGKWRQETETLQKVGIINYMSAPQVAHFDGWNEETMKVIISRYHYGKIWLDQPISITTHLIYWIIRLPLIGDTI